MARITVQDCLEHVDNRFNLVLLAAKRARQIENGMDPLVPSNNDKPTVIALREIAAGLVTPETVEPEESPEDLELSAVEKALAEEIRAEADRQQQEAP